MISCSSATTVTIFIDDDTTANRIFKGYFAANQGALADIDGAILLNPDQVIKITNVNPTASITIVGEEI